MKYFVVRIYPFRMVVSSTVRAPIHIRRMAMFVVMQNSTSSSSSSSSSHYCPSVANAPNVLQPYWLIVLPLDFPDLTACLLL